MIKRKKPFKLKTKKLQYKTPYRAMRKKGWGWQKSGFIFRRKTPVQRFKERLREGDIRPKDPYTRVFTGISGGGASIFRPTPRMKVVTPTTAEIRHPKKRGIRTGKHTKLTVGKIRQMYRDAISRRQKEIVPSKRPDIKPADKILGKDLIIRITLSRIAKNRLIFTRPEERRYYASIINSEMRRIYTDLLKFVKTKLLPKIPKDTGKLRGSIYSAFNNKFENIVPRDESLKNSKLRISLWTKVPYAGFVSQMQTFKTSNVPAVRHPFPPPYTYLNRRHGRVLNDTEAVGQFYETIRYLAAKYCRKILVTRFLRNVKNETNWAPIKINKNFFNISTPHSRNKP